MFAKLTSARSFLAAAGLALSCVIGAVAPSTASAAIPYLQLNAQEPKYAAIVIDANSGEVLYDKRADSPRYPASVTKVMTLYLTFEALSEGRLKLTDRVTMSPRAAAQAPTKIGLPAGDSLSVDEAIKAMTVKSANDVAVAMAERLAGSESRFAALMTLRGQELGMRNSRFVNASGLPDSRQISSARDLAILSRATMRDFPQYYSYFSTKGFYFRGNYIKGHNRLLDSMEGFDGLKTGYTNASGFNLAGSAVRDGRRLIAVVLGGPSTAWRDNNMEDLLLTGFDVMKRRSRGERTSIAANIYEDDPSGPIQRPATEQGDGDQAGLKIVLTENPRTPPVKVAPTLKAAQTPSKMAKPAPAKKPKGEWSVQVGAFKSKSLANDQLKLVEKRFSSLVSSAESAVETAGGTFRAQFQGMTADAARAACSAITAKRQPCMVLSPR
ncbi:D-alanyl-D-alanine carboxypeptidase family protein [Caulobacter sp. RHG1]|uniref:D-alanyl-D-alanine carboxypeptidase family protein n=1 Tax=Caulobacter sp. (strain RHG1) TaxID=2545762 RepID=UPI001552C6E3|nr:D-alanyl-D-alanine carboxypeptidase family protein [Caulobacter sp. RHG1]NQE63080.1 D-alanyl-D-alanine carboxypeptidase [Caulobacter sp. RHG1]